MYLRLTAIFVLIFTLLCGCTQSSDSGNRTESRTAKIDVASMFPVDLPVIGPAITRVVETTGRASGGSLKLTVYDNNKLVASKEILSAVSAGKVDAGYAACGFWQGKIQSAPIFSSVPFGPETGEYLAWMFVGNGLTLYQQMYDQNGFNVKVLIAAVLPPETSGWFAKPIDSPDDLKGLRMRFYGFGGDVMSKLGVGVELLDGSDIFPALEKGRLDAAEFSMPVIDMRLGFHKIVKYNYFPGWHQQATLLELLINKDVWNNLDESQQTIIELACQDAIVRSIAEGEGTQFDTMREQTEKHGVIRKQWSPEMLQLYRETWDQFAVEQAKSDPFFAEVWADLTKFRAGYDLWENYAFLPRGN